MLLLNLVHMYVRKKHRAGHFYEELELVKKIVYYLGSLLGPYSSIIVLSETIDHEPQVELGVLLWNVSCFQENMKINLYIS